MGFSVAAWMKRPRILAVAGLLLYTGSFLLPAAHYDRTVMSTERGLLSGEHLVSGPEAFSQCFWSLADALTLESLGLRYSHDLPASGFPEALCGIAWLGNLVLPLGLVRLGRRGRIARWGLVLAPALAVAWLRFSFQVHLDWGYAAWNAALALVAAGGRRRAERPTEILPLPD